jgi:hypothetical protein
MLAKMMHEEEIKASKNECFEDDLEHLRKDDEIREILNNYKKIEIEDPQSWRGQLTSIFENFKELEGVRNEWIERKMREFGEPSIIEGANENLQPCPCCQYKTIRERFTWEICRVCYWQDDTYEEEKISPANGTSMKKYRNQSEIDKENDKYEKYTLQIYCEKCTVEGIVIPQPRPTRPRTTGRSRSTTTSCTTLPP